MRDWEGEGGVGIQCGKQNVKERKLKGKEREGERAL